MMMIAFQKTNKMSASSSRHVPKRKVQPTVLNFMDGSRSTSSYSRQNHSSTDIFDLLRRAVNERRRIEVLTRDCRGICGILIGWLILFDKHMNLIMTDVDEVLRRLSDGHDYLELGPKRENIPPVKRKFNLKYYCLENNIIEIYFSIATASNSKPADVPNDFQTFRAQLANFLRNKNKPPAVAKQRRSHVEDDDTEDDDDEKIRKELAQPCQPHPEQFLCMELLSINNLNVQRLSGRAQTIDSSSSSSLPSTVTITSKRPKVRFFSRHVPKLFIKGNQVCLIRLLSS